MSESFIWELLLILVFMVLPVWPAWRICRRAGYSGLWGVTQFIPILGVVTMWVLAFCRWPVLRRKEEATADAAE